jgi:hypothetical protein
MHTNKCLDSSRATFRNIFEANCVFTESFLALATWLAYWHAIKPQVGLNSFIDIAFGMPEQALLGAKKIYISLKITENPDM